MLADREQHSNALSLEPWDGVARGLTFSFRSASLKGRLERGATGEGEGVAPVESAIVKREIDVQRSNLAAWNCYGACDGKSGERSWIQ